MKLFNAALLMSLLSLPISVFANTQCHVANQYDSNVLSLSWAPAYCELNGNRAAECKTLTQSRFDAKNFVIHGLWPNKKGCNSKTQWYSYCGSVKNKPKSFCDYPALEMFPKVREALEMAMPGAGHGSCLQRHEWFKHGACRDANPTQYFILSINLLAQVNGSDLVASFIKNNIGKRVKTADFKHEFEKSFGRGTFTKVTLSCRKGLLKEMNLSLPKTIDGMSNLKKLLNATDAPAAKPSNCGKSFKIDTV